MLLDHIKNHVLKTPEALAMRTSTGKTVAYKQLWEQAAVISHAIDEGALPGNTPVVVYGHKDPLMIASMVACMRTGHSYVPLDCFSLPANRMEGIVRQIIEAEGACLVLASEEWPLPDIEHCTVADARQIATTSTEAAMSDSENWICGEDTAYIIFTSGSTGTPKGVEVSASCIENFYPWALDIAQVSAPGTRFMNQAPFSFDLSVYELTMALASGGCICSLEKETLDHAADMLAFFHEADPQVWVSTPSFAQMCLANKDFAQQMMPSLRRFLFCGETLENLTAQRLMDNFPLATVVNSYGPTESTVAVAATPITLEQATSDEPLPVGTPKPGTVLHVLDFQGNPVAPDQWGEVVIQGTTVAKGYYNRPDLTAKAFDAQSRTRQYKTGDEGRLDEKGMLHFRGRLDLQVKLNGFRLELGEIENQLIALEQVNSACVVAARKAGKITHLVAYVVMNCRTVESDFKEGLALKALLKKTLPHYMIPKKIVIREALPLTPNGKLDRKSLAAENVMD